MTQRISKTTPLQYWLFMQWVSANKNHTYLEVSFVFNKHDMYIQSVSKKGNH